MENYNIEFANQVYISLDVIYEHKKEYDPLSAIRFVSGFFDEVQKLSYLPYRGINKANNTKGLLYKNHLIIYKIQEPNQVRILDIIDPRQYTIASKYY
jgi:plasmid stabilization system protein ParE